ncbi:MAG: hypothetical protein JOZ78_21820 [Chroococcidiopsidaceae cyanobacterium CP_BM_ER_R8_30]|nr:hypothetical protein [Chroococcidiopsidaceae cyanobacterium CP_BM_ER_R8_30]
MKVLGLVLSTLLLLVTPALAAEYQGRSIDGRKFAAKAYYSATGGVYQVQVRFNRNRATIYFDDGSQTTIKLRRRVITDPSDIEGFGRLGQFYLGGIFSAGLDYTNTQDYLSNRQPPTTPQALQGFWRISLDSKDLSTLSNYPLLRHSAQRPNSSKE